MERLTARTTDGILYSKRGYEMVLARLENYEDTKLTPEEVKTNEEVYEAYRHVCGGKSPETIKKALELLYAEEQGLLIKLPVSIGTELLLDTELLGCNIGRMPYKITGVEINLFGDWGAASQSRSISLVELAETLKGSAQQ